MFYFPKFCRICIKIENCKNSLVDVDTLDYDKIRLSEKLKACSNMEINKESLSTLMCEICIKKLRTAYEFRDMCQKSTALLQNYLSELLSVSQDSLSAEKFINSELYVSLIRIPHIDNKPAIKSSGNKIKLKKNSNNKYVTYFEEKNRIEKFCPMKDLINFSKSFDFGFTSTPLVSQSIKCPIEKLEEFSKKFFQRDFADYNNTILQIRNSQETWELEELFEDEELEDKIHFEEIVIEPYIKMELEFCDEDTEDPFVATSDIVETCYYPETSIKEEIPDVPVLQNKNVLFSRTGIGTTNSNFIPSQKGRRCRTHGNPFINPQLRKQFLTRSFVCPTCCRTFKSPGYLKNHLNKLMH